MSKVMSILKTYLNDMLIKDDVPLGEKPRLKISEKKATELTKVLYDQLQKQNKFSRIVNWVVLGLYSVLFGIILYVLFAFVIQTPQPLSIIFGGSGVVASLIMIIKGIRNLSKDTGMMNTIMLLSRKMDPTNLSSIVDLIYTSHKKKK